jgi:hypothetical protein
MRVLLLHPEDTLPLHSAEMRWDLIVDLARAPSTTYESWRRSANCEVFSLFRFAEEINDLGRLRKLLQSGLGVMVDSLGFDWWDLLGLFIAGDLQQLTLIHRLSRTLPASCELYASRPHPLATALSEILCLPLTILQGPLLSVIHRARHYRNAFVHLDRGQLVQILEDKFDGEHWMRQRLAPRRASSGRPVVLLPSAYVNVTRTALSCAQLLPDHQFLLVYTRNSGKPRSLPSNVRAASLSSYFVSNGKSETVRLLASWNTLTRKLVQEADEFDIANRVGILTRIPALLPWGVALRNAWSKFFECENVTACLSADDSNPPSSIPLLMAKQRGLHALATHHGALDSTIAIKENHADFYLAKNEMERDYLQRICRLTSEKIAMATPSHTKSMAQRPANHRSAPWLVFFSEPYQSYWWRSDEIYSDLVPRLYSLAQSCGLKLVLKLHPFESVNGHRRMLRRFLPERGHEIKVIAGQSSDQLWTNTRLAVTVQSSTALECANRGIPVFLCAWLRDPYSGYALQYARFGAGEILQSLEQIAEIPSLINRQNARSWCGKASWGVEDSEHLSQLLGGADALAMASTA